LLFLLLMQVAYSNLPSLQTCPNIGFVLTDEDHPLVLNYYHLRSCFKLDIFSNNTGNNLGLNL